MSFLNVLTLIFVVMKLMGHVDWSWWLVLLPSTVHVFLGAALVVLAVLIKK